MVARQGRQQARPELHRGGDPDKDQSYVLWGIAKGTNSAPTALGVFDVRGDKVQAMQVGSDSRGAYTDFKTYAISHEPGHTAPSRPSQIVALGNV